MYMSDKLRHIVQNEMGRLHTGKFQTQVSMVFSLSVVRGHVPDPHIMEKQAFVSVIIVTVAGVCEAATGLTFVWVFCKNWSSHDW